MLGWEIPTLRWFFSFSDIGENQERNEIVIGASMLAMVFAVAIAIWLTGKNFEWNPITLRRFKGFRTITRGYYSFLILGGLIFFAMLDQVVVGREALAVRYEGKWHFPAFTRNKPKPNDLGENQNTPLDYRKLKKRFQDQQSPNLVIMPLIPWDSTFDSQDLEEKPLQKRDGKYFLGESKTPFAGLAVTFHPSAAKKKQYEASFRNGQLHGDVSFFDEAEAPIGQRKYDNGRAMPSANHPSLKIPDDAAFFKIAYAPTAPNFQTGHFLGTDARGWDVAAQLYGGLQVVIKASVLYVFLTFFIGIVIGLVSGYFGGIVDLITQRLLEILQNMPFLLIVMIIAARWGKENVNIITIVAILCLFSWIGISQYKRTAALKEKARDYVAAARVMGAGTSRILFCHILPNVLSTSITLVPFTVTAVATSLTALDFLGFGLPDKFPSWGTLLEIGITNLEAPWIVSSVFAMIFLILILITFIGEAIREAFDPKKFTTYQ